MDVDRPVQRLGRFQDRPVFRVVEIFAVGVRVQDEAVELERADRARHFFRRPLGVLRREGGEPGIARGMAPDRLGEAVVGERRDLTGEVGVEHLHAGRGERQQVHRHAVLVHGREPFLVEIDEAAVERASRHGAAAGKAQVEAVPIALAELEHRRQMLGDRERLLGRDAADLGLRFGHGATPRECAGELSGSASAAPAAERKAVATLSELTHCALCAAAPAPLCMHETGGWHGRRQRSGFCRHRRRQRGLRAGQPPLRRSGQQGRADRGRRRRPAASRISASSGRT